MKQVILKSRNKRRIIIYTKKSDRRYKKRVEEKIKMPEGFTL